MPKHPLNIDPYARPASEAEYGTRHPGRYEARQPKVGSTQALIRMRARVHGNAATQSIPSGAAVNTVVVLDTVDFDTAGLLAGNGFTIPSTGKVTGPWQLHAHVTWDASASGFRETNILANGVELASTHVLGSNDQQSQDATVTVNDPVPGTVYTVVVNQTSGGNLNLLKESFHTYFEIIHQW